MPALLVLAGRTEREKAHRWIDAAPVNARVTFAGPKRNLEQNAAMWRLLTKVSEQYLHHGQRLAAEDFRLLFLDALNREARTVPALDNRGWVSLGRSTSKLSKTEFSDLLELITAWCVQNGINIDDSSEGKGAAEKAALTAA